MARVPPGHWGTVRAPGRGASGVAGGRAERPGQRPRLCRAHGFTPVHPCVAAPYALFFVSCVSPQETPTRRRQPAKPGALCGFRDIHTYTAGRLFLCGCASTLWKRAPGTAQLQHRISTLCKPLRHTVGNPGQMPNSCRRRPIWRCIGGLFLRVGICPFAPWRGLGFSFLFQANRGPFLGG